MIRHTVRPGEDISTIARSHGMPAEKVWRENEDLQQHRDSPDILNPGDAVYIEDRELRHHDCPTEQRHRFRSKLAPAWLRLRFLDDGEPRADEPYTLKINALTIRGTLDAEGRLEQRIPHDAAEALLRLGESEDYLIKLGCLDPLSEPAGIQARLAHLGYACNTSGKLDRQTEQALRAFQADNSLEPSGVPDKATLDALNRLHES